MCASITSKKTPNNITPTSPLSDQDCKQLLEIVKTSKTKHLEALACKTSSRHMVAPS